MGLPSRRFPATEKEWIRFRDFYNPIFTRLAVSQGVSDPEEVKDVVGKVWEILLVKGFADKYDPKQASVQAFLVGLAKTVAFFEYEHAKRRPEKRHTAGWMNGEELGAGDRAQAVDLALVEFHGLLEAADKAVHLRRVNAIAGPNLIRRVWAGLKADESRLAIAKAAGVSVPYVGTLVKEIRGIPEVRALIGVIG